MDESAEGELSLPLPRLFQDSTASTTISEKGGNAVGVSEGERGCEQHDAQAPLISLALLRWEEAATRGSASWFSIVVGGVGACCFVRARHFLAVGLFVGRFYLR